MTPDSLKRLREWFKKNAAELPWRLADLDAPRDAYAVWISETMLQQTQVSTVKEYFIRWMERFPNIEKLAEADEAEVFKYWQGLGYYSRARNILKTARIVCESCFKSDKICMDPPCGRMTTDDGKLTNRNISDPPCGRMTTDDGKLTNRNISDFPCGRMTTDDGKLTNRNISDFPCGRMTTVKTDSPETESGKTNPCSMPKTRKELEALPGIGAYTAGAILSLAYHQREAILDGNLVRIFSRLYELDFLPMDSSSAAEIYWGYAREVADSPKAFMHNEALMELGRTVCKTKSPLCEKCPLNRECRAFIDKRTAEFPPAKKRTEKNWHGTVLVIESADEKILAVSGGQKFLDKQLALPHFESPRGATVGLPAQAENYINADDVESIKQCGTFRHSITVHKIECDVLHVRLTTKAKAAYSPKQTASSNKSTSFAWIEKAKVFETFANSFSLKALKKVF